MIGHSAMILRIAIGAALGGVIGFERDLHRRHVGLRTHIIVAMTAATFMVISTQFTFFQGFTDSTHHIEIDASRIAASVVSGIGFLAGGAILRTGATVQGLTTAAGLWLVTAIGMCAGAGMYIESSAVTIMGLIALTVLRLFEDKDDHFVQRQVSLTLTDSPESVSSITAAVQALGGKISRFDYERQVDDQKIWVKFRLSFPVEIETRRIIEQIERQSCVRKVQVEHLH